MKRTLISGGSLLTLDPSVGDLRVGDVLVEDGRIAAIAPRLEVEDAELIDATDRIVMPGLIDAHRHLWYAGLRGTSVDETWDELVAAVWGKLGPAFTPQDVYAFTRHGIAEALDNGITCVFDWCHVINTPEHAEAGVQAHLDLGMRAVFGYGASMTQKLDEFAGEFQGASWGHAEQLHGRYFSSPGRLTMALALQGPEFTTVDVTVRDVTAAREIGVPMAFHVGIPMGPPPRKAVAALAQAGLLADDMSFAHCCNTTAEEFDILAAAGGRPMSCPVVDATLGMGSSPTGLMRERGLAACFTADAVIASTGDMFEEARVGMMLERYDGAKRRFSTGQAVTEHDDRISAREALGAVTLQGARCCWLEEQVGSLTVGKQADIVLLNAEHMNLWPATDLLATVVNCAHGQNVDTVLVAGEIVKRDGRLVDVDLAGIRRDTAVSRDRLYAAAGYDNTSPA